MLKTTGLFKKSVPKTFKANSTKVFRSVDSGKAYKTVKNLFPSKKAKNESQTHMPNIGATEKLEFLTPGAKETFNQLRLAFTKALILWHFHLKYYIAIETDALSHDISRVLS